MAAGSIVIDLLLHTGSFVTDTKRAEKALGDFQRQAKQIGVGIGAAMATAALAVVAVTKRSIDLADDMSKLAQKTGTTTEDISALAHAANLAGISQEDLGTGLAKLAKKMSDAAGGSKEAAAFFNTLGISVKGSDGALKSTDKVLGEIANKFSGFADGAGKTALAMEGLGKSGASWIPLLNGGSKAIEEMRREAEALGLVISTETGRNAEEFNDNLTRLGSAVTGVGNRIATALLPSLVEISKILVDLVKVTDLVNIAAKAVILVVDVLTEVFKALFTAVSDVYIVLNSTATLLIGVSAAINTFREAQSQAKDALLGGHILDAQKIVVDGWQRAATTIGLVVQDIKDSYKDVTQLQTRVNNFGKPQDDTGAFEAGYIGSTIVKEPKKPNAPITGAAGKAGEADKLLKKALDAQLALIRDFAEQQRDAYAFADQYAQAYYDKGALSLQAFYDQQDAIRRAGLGSQVEALDKEIAAQLAFLGKATEAKNKIEAQGKIDAAKVKKEGLLQKGLQDDSLAREREAAGLKAIGQQYDELNAKVLELSGNTAGAAAIRNRQTVADASKLIEQAGGDPKQADRLAKRLADQSALSEGQDKYNRLLEQTRNAEELVLLASEASGASEIETLRAVGDVRAKALDQLGAMAVKARELAEASKTPDAIAFADNLAIAYKRAAAQVDPLLEKTRALGQQLGASAANKFSDFPKQFREDRSALRDELAGLAIEKKGLQSDLASRDAKTRLNAALKLEDIERRSAEAREKYGNTFKKLLHSIGDDIQQMLTKTLITDPLGKSLGDMLGGTGTSGGLLGGLFGKPPAGKDAAKDGKTADGSKGSATDGLMSALGGLFGGTGAGDAGGAALSGLSTSAGAASLAINSMASAAAAAALALQSVGTSGASAGVTGLVGNASSGSSSEWWGSLLSMFAHTGGVIGEDAIPHRSGDRLKSNERRAVLEVGEEVLTRDDPRHRNNFIARRYHTGGVVGSLADKLYGREGPKMSNRPGNSKGDSRPIQINQTFAAGTSKATADQAAASAADALRRASGRTR